MASSSTKLTMKLLIDTKNQKVLFAEASKPVIDFLFNLLRLPIGTVVRLLNKNGMVGSIGNLYQSVENLNESYMQLDQGKDVLLKPKALNSSTEVAGLLLPANDDGASNILAASSFYTRRQQVHVTCNYATYCPECSKPMFYGVNYVGKKVAGDKGSSIKSGFVKEMVAFMVMDDLVVQPMSISSINTLLNKFNVKDVGALQEKVIELGTDEGVNLLKASLESNMVLTNLFIKKNMKKVAPVKKRRLRRRNIMIGEIKCLGLDILH